MNQISIVGNVGKDPELRVTQGGKQVASFSVATTRGRDESKQTTWHNVVCFDEMAENVIEAVKKGSRVVVIGRQENSTFEGRDGQKRSKSEIVADEVCLSIRYRRESRTPERHDRPEEPF